MAHMNQEKKKILAPGIKAVLKKYGMKGTISVRDYSSLVVTVNSGKLDMSESIGDRGYTDVNHYWIENHYEGAVKEFLIALRDAMNIGNHDNSDSQTDYFNVGWYISIAIGKWNKKYIQTI